MHEFSIIYNVLRAVEDVAKQNHFNQVDKIILRIGKLRQVMPDFLQFAFEASSEDTISEGAKLEIIEVPITIKCLTCQKEFEAKRQTYICPHCEGIKLEILSGKELLIDSIEGEKAE